MLDNCGARLAGRFRISSLFNPDLNDDVRYLPVMMSADQLRVGNDIMSVDEVRDSITRFGDRYLRRVYTVDELAYCGRSAAEFAERLAARFAAKEAVLKVLRPVDAWPSWRDIEIVRAPAGWCEVRLLGGAAELARRERVTILSCSLSHDRAYASAVVLGQAVSSSQ